MPKLCHSQPETKMQNQTRPAATGNVASTRRHFRRDLAAKAFSLLDAH
jgi:hypothetical protein